MSRIFTTSDAVRAPIKALAPGLAPVSITHTAGHASVIHFSSGKVSTGTCLYCLVPPCMQFTEAEVMSRSVPEFPADRNVSVCPAGSMTRDGGGPPVINVESCVACGVCASRCPTGAIVMRPIAEVVDIDVDAFPQGMLVEQHNESLALLSAIPKVGGLVVESDEVIELLSSRVQAAWQRIGERFPALIARNLLIAAGVGASIRRKGDTAARMDVLLGPPWPIAGCAEAEFGDTAVLEVPRDILDDVAVLVGRLGMHKDELEVLFVTDVLPNRRSEYWRIVQDIRNVLGIRIGTVTILALCLHVWNFKSLASAAGGLFYVDVDTPSYRVAVLEAIVGRPLKIGSTPQAFVEVAK